MVSSAHDGGGGDFGRELAEYSGRYGELLDQDLLKVFRGLPAGEEFVVAALLVPPPLAAAEFRNSARIRTKGSLVTFRQSRVVFQ